MAQVKAFSLGGIGAPCCCSPSPEGCDVTFCVTGCPDGTALPGATVTVTSGDTTIGSCTTATSGSNACCSIDVGTAGSYTVTVSATGYYTYTGNLALTCNETVNVALQPNTAPASAIFTVNGCCGNALAGATITLSDGQSCTTDSSGQCSFWEGAAGTYTYTVTSTRFADATGSFTLSGCATTTTGVTVNMTPADGYACGPYQDEDGNPLPVPIPTTLNLTSALYGSTTLAYDAATAVWSGTITGVSFAGNCSCPASTFSLLFQLTACTISPLLAVNYNACQYVFCGGETIMYPCPSDPTDITCTGHEFTNQLIDCCDIITGTGPCGAGDYGDYPWEYGGTGWTLTSIPFDMTATIPAIPCCGTEPCATIAWTAGDTLTITE